jgi:hypothetical protein
MAFGTESKCSCFWLRHNVSNEFDYWLLDFLILSAEGSWGMSFAWYGNRCYELGFGEQLYCLGSASCACALADARGGERSRRVS